MESLDNFFAYFKSDISRQWAGVFFFSLLLIIPMVLCAEAKPQTNSARDVQVSGMVIDGATGEALPGVNKVRIRAFNDPTGELYTTATLTMDTLLAERGWELVGEGKIRFGLAPLQPDPGSGNSPVPTTEVFFPYRSNS